MTSQPKVAGVAVLGSGSWGTALAMQLARSGLDTTLWGRDRQRIAAMKSAGCNQFYLPDHSFPDSLQLTASLARAVAGRQWLFVCVPSHAFTGVVEKVHELVHASDDCPADLAGLAWACKGLEPGTGRFLHESAARILGGTMPLAVVTGPSFAREVAANMPTAVTVAGTHESFCTLVARSLHSGNFRAYTSNDMVGAGLGGAVKNVLAVATGICDGMELGNSARAALMTRGMAEMMRLGRAMGALDQTLAGLAGMGDLVLTCTGDLSRNRRLGLALGRGIDLATAVADIGQVVEGVTTSEEVWRLGQAHDVDMPITEQVEGIIHRHWNPAEAVRRLLARELKAEDG